MRRQDLTSFPLPFPEPVKLPEVFAGHGGVVDDQHVLIVGGAGVLGGIERAGDHDLAVNDEELVVEVVKVLVPADVDTAVFEDPVTAPGAVLPALHHPLNIHPGQVDDRGALPPPVPG